MSYSKHGNSSYQAFHKNASFRNTTDFNRDWRNNRNYSRRNLNAPSARNNRRLIALAVSVLLILICVIIIIVLFSKNSDTPGEEIIECPPGFNGNGCQNSDFIGSLVWSDAKFYKLVDEKYYNRGIAFRVYAPGAESVSVLTKMPEEEERSSAMKYYPFCTFSSFRRQDDNYWFYNVGGVGYGCEFAYEVRGNGKSAIHLIQNGKFV